MYVWSRENKAIDYLGGSSSRSRMKNAWAGGVGKQKTVFCAVPTHRVPLEIIFETDLTAKCYCGVFGRAFEKHLQTQEGVFCRTHALQKKGFF